MLDLSTAVLCDFAQVRDRLLFVSSGAVSRLYRQELPSPLGLMVGLVIEVPLEDAGMEHQLRAEVINRHGTVLATLENTFRVSDAGLFPHEVQQVPLVLSITGVRARTWGTHQVRLYLDSDLVRALTLYVVPAAGPQAQVRATPTQSRVDDTEGTVGGTGTDGVADTPPAGDEQPLGEPAPIADDDDDASVVLLREDPLEDLDAPVVLDGPAPSAPDVPGPAFSEPVVSTAPPPEPHEALDWGDPIDAPTPPESVRFPTIDAPQAGEPPAPEARVFDFEDEPSDEPNDEAGDEDEPPETSRFSFRYLVDDEG